LSRRFVFLQEIAAFHTNVAFDEIHMFHHMPRLLTAYRNTPRNQKFARLHIERTRNVKNPILGRENAVFPTAHLNHRRQRRISTIF